MNCLTATSLFCTVPSSSTRPRLAPIAAKPNRRAKNSKFNYRSKYNGFGNQDEIVTPVDVNLIEPLSEKQPMWVPVDREVPDKFASTVEIEELVKDHNPRTGNWNAVKKQLYTNVDNYNGKVQDQYTGEWYDFTDTTSFAPLSVEHIVPRSIVKKDPQIITDLHNLIPVERNLNSKRSNLPYGPFECPFAPSCVIDGKMMIRDEIKGFIARSVIYVMVMYKNKLKRINKQGVGSLRMFVNWCLEFAPSEYELNRNDRISAIQGNRNPFIDNPELCKLAESIQ